MIAVLTLPEAQRMTGKGDAFDEIDVAGKPGVSPATLKQRIAPIVPRNVEVRTGTEQADKQTRDIKTGFLDVLRTALLAFAGISLFVGAFLIFNTFSITVAQRTREFALLRVLGAKRKQVLRSVLGEGLVLGVVGSAVGLVLGIARRRRPEGAVQGLRRRPAVDQHRHRDPDHRGVLARRDDRDADLDARAGLPGDPRAAAGGAARGPQRRAEALALRAPVGHHLDHRRPGAHGPRPVRRRQGERGAVSLMGVGAVFTFLGVAFLSPRLVGPIAGFVGAPFERFRGITGRIARENTVRFPGRTAVTAGALMVGVALVTFASVFAAGAKETISDAVHNGSRAQAVVEGTNFGSFSHEATQAVAQVPGVKEVGALRNAQAKVDGRKVGVSGIDPQTFPDLYHADWKQGNDDVLRSAQRPGRSS